MKSIDFYYSLVKFGIGKLKYLSTYMQSIISNASYKVNPTEEIFIIFFDKK